MEQLYPAADALIALLEREGFLIVAREQGHIAQTSPNDNAD
jgi:hypothetical protein